MRKLVSVDLIFENCEYASIPAVYIHYLYIKDIRESARYFGDGDYEHFPKRTDDFSITFTNTDDIKVKDGNKSILEHLHKYKDITHIDLCYNDGSNSYITIPWGSKNCYHNAWQEVKFNDHYIKVECKKGWTIKKVLAYIDFKLKVSAHIMKRKLRKETLTW